MSYKDPTAQLAYQREWMRRRRHAFFQDKNCANCGVTATLELDHIDPTKKVTHAIWSWAEPRRQQELLKCQVLCQECHKQKTREYYRARVAHGTWCMRYRVGCTCSICIEGVRSLRKQYYKK